jgi:hypothetical protein
MLNCYKILYEHPLNKVQLSVWAQVDRKGTKEMVMNLLFSVPDFDRSPNSSAYLSGRRRESDANNFLGAVSKLFIL